MNQPKITYDLSIKPLDSQEAIIGEIEQIPELIKASLDCIQANAKLGAHNSNKGTINFGILKDKKERELFLNKLKLTSDGLKILNFILNISDYFQNDLSFNIEKFKLDGLSDDIFQKTFFYFGLSKEALLKIFPELSVIKEKQEDTELYLPEIPEYYSKDVIGDKIYNFIIKILGSPLSKKDRFTSLYLGFLYKVETTFLIQFCELKLNQINKEYSYEDKKGILLKTIDKFNKRFLKDINQLGNLQQKSYQMELITSIFFDELKNSGTGLEDLKNIGLEAEENQSSKTDIDENTLVLKSLMEMYEESYPGKYRFQNDIQSNIFEAMETGKFKTIFIKFNRKNIMSLTIEYKDDHIYIGGLNINKDLSYFNIGFWYAEEIIKKLGKENDLECTVTYEIEGEKNRNSKILLRKYKSLGFKKYGQGETNNSKYYKLRMNKKVK